MRMALWAVGAMALSVAACGKTAKDFSGSYAGTTATTSTLTATLPDGTKVSQDNSKAPYADTVTFSAPNETTLSIPFASTNLSFTQSSSDDNSFALVPTSFTDENITMKLTTGSLTFDGTSVKMTASGTVTGQDTSDQGPVTLEGPLTATFDGTKQ
jgi:hypothetical protein